MSKYSKTEGLESSNAAFRSYAAFTSHSKHSNPSVLRMSAVRCIRWVGGAEVKPKESRNPLDFSRGLYV